MQDDSTAGTAALYSALGRQSFRAATPQQAARGSAEAATAPSQQMPASALPVSHMQQPHTDTPAAVLTVADAARPHHDMLSDMQKEQNKRRANRNRITWGTRASRIASRLPTVSRPESSTDSGSVAAGSALQPQLQLQQEQLSHTPKFQQQPHGQAGGRPRVKSQALIERVKHGINALVQGTQQRAQAPTPQQSIGVASGPMQVQSCLMPSAATVLHGPELQQPAAAAQDTTMRPGQLLCQVQVEHSAALVQLGQVLQKLARQRDQQHWRKLLKAETVAGEIASVLPAATASGSKTGSGIELALQPSKVGTTSQFVSTAAASMSPSPPPTGAMTADGVAERGLPLPAVRPDADFGSGSIPAEHLQQLSSSPSPSAAFGSVQQATALQPFSSGTLGLVTASQYTGKLPVVQLPMAMRVSYLRAAGFLPPAIGKPSKRKAEKQLDDGIGKPVASRKRSRRRFNNVDQPVVGWDARSYTHGSDRQRVWEEHLMVLRVIDHVLNPESDLAARVRQATVEYNARSCVCCWRARPVSGSWYCSRPICWDKHKAEYEGPAVTHASIAAVDEVHWGDVKDIVQPVLKQREGQQDGSTTPAAVAAAEPEAATGGGDVLQRGDLDAVVDVSTAGGPAAAAEEDGEGSPTVGVAPDSLAASSRASPETAAGVKRSSPGGDTGAVVTGSSAATQAGEQLCRTLDADVADAPGRPTEQQQEVLALDTSVEASRDNQQDMQLNSAAVDPVDTAREMKAAAGSVGKKTLTTDVRNVSSSAAGTTVTDVTTQAPAVGLGTATDDLAGLPADAVAAPIDPAAVSVSAAPAVSAAPTASGDTYQAPEAPVKDFVLPTREYKYPDLKRLWQEHQLNMRVLLIEVKDRPQALARLQDAIVRVFDRPCLRCLGDSGHKCGNGCWFCGNCQRAWGKINPITVKSAWEAITSGVGVDPKYVKRRGPSAAQVADAAQAVKALDALQQQVALPMVQAPV